LPEQTFDWPDVIVGGSRSAFGFSIHCDRRYGFLTSESIRRGAVATATPGVRTCVFVSEAELRCEPPIVRSGPQADDPPAGAKVRDHALEPFGHISPCVSTKLVDQSTRLCANGYRIPVRCRQKFHVDHVVNELEERREKACGVQ
jgi:hypothetical protein